jgi:ADP-heptose:LPS heptosyltransferase
MRQTKNKKRLKHFCITIDASLEEIIFCLPTVNILAATSKNRSITLAVPPQFADLMEYAKGINQIFAFKPSWNPLKNYFQGQKLKQSIGYSPDQGINLTPKNSTKLFFASLQPQALCELKHKANPQEHRWLHFANSYFHFRELKDYLDSYSLEEFFPLIRIPKTLQKQISSQFNIGKDGAPNSKIIALIPGNQKPSNESTNCKHLNWPIQNWVSFFKLLEEPDNDKYHVLLIGNEHDIKTCDDLIWELPGVSKLKISNLSGKLNYLEMGATLSLCDIVIGGDCELTHLASAVGTPTMALFTPTQTQHKAPFSGIALQATDYLCAQNCNKSQCERKVLNCMESLSPEEVWLAINEIEPQQLR